MTTVHSQGSQVYNSLFIAQLCTWHNEDQKMTRSRELGTVWCLITREMIAEGVRILADESGVVGESLAAHLAEDVFLAMFKVWSRDEQARGECRAREVTMGCRSQDQNR